MSFSHAQCVAVSHSDAKRDTYADCDDLSYTNSVAERLPRRRVYTTANPAHHGYTNAKPNGYAFAHGGSGNEYLYAAAG